MKKIFAIALVLVMMLSLVACGNDAKSDKVAAYVKDNGDAIVDSFIGSLTSSGMTCEVDIKAVGCGIVLDAKINELEDVPDELKDQMQEMYDAMDSYFDVMLAAAQKELPELEYITFNICERDGDIVATLKIDYAQIPHPAATRQWDVFMPRRYKTDLGI